MRTTVVIPLLLSFTLAACKTEPSNSIAWATVDLGSIESFIQNQAELQNPELAEKIQSIRGSYDKKRDIRDALYQFRRSAKKQCKKMQDKPLSQVDELRGISAYDACLFDIESLPDMVKLKQELQQLESLNEEVSALKKQMREMIELRMDELLKAFSQGRYDLVISHRQKIYYNAGGKVLDVTDEFKTFVASKNLDLSAKSLLAASKAE